MKSSFFCKITRLAKRSMALFLVFATIFTMFTITNETEAEADSGVAVSNALIIKISMGSVTTDQISYLSVKYLSSGDDLIRTVVFVPTKENMAKSYALAEKRLGTTTASKKATYLKNGTDSLNFDFGSLSEGIDPFQTMKATYIYIETPYDIDCVCGFNFFAKGEEKGTNEIGIQDISIYKVEKLYDIDMAGNFSTEYYIDFSGKKVMTSKITRTFTWTSSRDVLFSFNSIYYGVGNVLNLGENYYSASFVKNLDRVDVTREMDSAVNLTFQIDIADVFGAGAEYLNSYVLSDGGSYSFYKGWVVEPLELQASYTDASGIVHYVNVPVVLSSLYKATSSSGSVTMKSKVSGLAQQGNSLVFDINLFNCTDADSVSYVLVNGRDTVKNDIGFSWTGRGNYKATANDSVSISSIKVYETSAITYSASADTGFVVPTVTGTPKWYFKSPLSSGTEIPEETTFAIPLSKSTGTEDFTVSTSTGKFLITLKTDTPASASTTDEINVKIKYKSYTGEEKETETIIVSEAVGDYTGYWPATKSSNNFAYQLGVCTGQTMSFIVDIPDADSFLGMTFSLGNGSTDEWQGSAIGIFEIKKLGTRTVTWETLVVNGYFTDRKFSRDNSTVNISPTLTGPFLVEPDESTYVSFTSGGSTIVDNDVDWEDYKYEMSYEEATQNMGFTKSRAIYTVTVKVSGDIVTGSVDENCGSDENFYFKLVFEDGSTGYVQANQQLTSDGFISGEEQDFSIIANSDMGNLSAIKILPESRDESEAFDKLMIEYINVTKSGGDGLSLTWRVDVNSWITAEYQDTGAKDSDRGQAGRTENELAQTFKVSSKGYSLDMMISVTTKSYTGTAFEGKLSAEIDYIDSSNVVQTKKIDDVVNKFAEYAGRTGEIETYTPANNQATFKGTVIDRDYMLRANHTDRFFVSLVDVTKIVRIRFIVNSVTAGQWTVDGVSVFRVISKGNKMFNENNEYQYNGEVELVCQSSSTIPYSVQYTASGNDAVLPILFGDNKIDVDLSSTWISSITYEPQSNDDSINVYAYMGSGADNISDYEMKMAVSYALSDETQRETISTLKPDKENNMFYAKDIKVAGLRVLRKLGLKSDSFNTEYSPVSYVIVEHIRSGVLINTYYIDFNNQDVGALSYYQYAKPDTDNSTSTETETLTFMVSNDSTPVKIINGTSDLAVCINYNTTNDPVGSTVASPNYFISNLGISTLSPGDIITITLDQKCVKDITSITFVGQGAVANAIKIKAAKISTQTTDANDNTEYTNFYSFGTEMQGFVSYSPKNMTVTATTSKNITIPNGTQKSVGLLTLGFTTKEGTSGVSDSSKICIKIGYYDDYSVAKEMTISDLSAYIASGSFDPGETAYAKLLISGISSIRYVYVEPLGGNSWTISRISAKLSIDSDGVAEERIINKTLSTGAGETIGFGNVKIQVVAYVSKGDVDERERRGYSSASDVSEGILMTLGNNIEFTPTIDGSISGVTVTCSSVSTTAAGNQVTSDVTNKVITKQYKGTQASGQISSFTFLPTEVGDYRITVTSQEIASTSVVINISVQAAEEETVEESAQEE